METLQLKEIMSLWETFCQLLLILFLKKGRKERFSGKRKRNKWEKEIDGDKYREEW